MTDPEQRRSDALRYHAEPHPGKLSVEPSKPCSTQWDLSLAYTPGVAEPVRAIAADPATAFDYTTRANLVGVITNGTAVLGLGDTGPLAAKPVMEGKAVLFKRFAHIDVFDLEIAETDPEAFIETVARLEPTFGGINLEDIAAPHCFRIEEALKERLCIPVFHDDQHGTAIITAAGLLNALELQGKRLADAHITCIGAGSAAIATLRLLRAFGADPAKIRLTDRSGVVHAGRAGQVDEYKAEFAADTDARTLDDAVAGADVVIGVSVGGMLGEHHIASLADRPVVFALANPEPEIRPEVAHEVRGDLLMATGRSDYPNQVNNVLGFPFIFRGALDVRARQINTEMQMAAARALADLARQPVPDEVAQAYDVSRLSFGPDYFIPKPLDPRLIQWVSPAVAQAAADTGAATIAPPETAEYAAHLEGMQDRSMLLLRKVMHRAHSDPRRVIYPEGENRTILRALDAVREEGVAEPMLIGRESVIRARMAEEGVDGPGVTIIDPAQLMDSEAYTADLHALRGRRGLSWRDARRAVRTDPFRLAALMVRRGEADAMVGGVENHYATLLRPSLEIIPHRRAFGMHLLFVGERPYLLGDTTVNIDPDSGELARMAVEAAALAREFGMDPHVALLSFSNFGASRSPRAEKVREAVHLLHDEHPELEVEGEMQADAALEPDLLHELFPHARLSRPANVLLFPDLDAGNAAYKLLDHLGRAQVVGPILVGMEKPVQIVEWGAPVTDVVHMTAIAVQGAQRAKGK
jgi:malate dehydrogenase (oxaloacetate-decarboxylating)(NADP+)